MCLIALLPLHFRFLRQQTPVVLAARSRFSSTLRLNTSAFDHDAVLESQRRNHKPMPLTVNRNAVKRNARFSNTSIDFTCHKLGRLFLHVCRCSSNYHFRYVFDTRLIFINYRLRYRRCRQMKKRNVRLIIRKVSRLSRKSDKLRRSILSRLAVNALKKKKKDIKLSQRSPRSLSLTLSPFVSFSWEVHKRVTVASRERLSS